MVSTMRFERMTDRLEGDCSIQLSYADIRQYKYITKQKTMQVFFANLLVTVQMEHDKN